jgi:sentrin-specific protease 7
MDKAFGNVPKVEARRSKRPSTETIPESPNDARLESVKRQKLSATLQGEDNATRGIKQPPRRVPLPKTQSESNTGSSTQSEEKKYQASSKDRQTRSKARRGLVDLVDNEPATTYNVPSGNGTWSKPLVYPREGKKKAEVDSNDLERLRDGEFLNDNLIGLYLRFLEHHLERNNPEVAKRVYFFNSYFFATLTSSPRGKKGVNYEAVQKWTRNVDLFSHDYVIVPINENAHWYLAIICNLGSLKKREEEVEPCQQIVESDEIPETPPPERATPEESARDSLASMKISTDVPGSSQQVRESDDEWPEMEENRTTPPAIFQNKTPSKVPESKQSKKGSEKAKKPKRAGPIYSIDQPTIVTFDSLGLGRSPAVKFLRSYLLEEASAKQSLELNTKDIKGMTAKEIPLQPNYSDCGLYLLAYLEKFAQDPDVFIGKLLQKEMSAEDDWPALKSGLLRRRLRGFLFDLHAEQDSGDYGLVDARPISYLLGPSATESVNGAEPASPAHVAELEVIPDSIQEEVHASADPALTYDSAGEAVVQETQLSQQDTQTPNVQHEPEADHPEDQHAEEVVQLPQKPERKLTKPQKPSHSPAPVVPNIKAGLEEAAFSSTSEQPVQAGVDIFDDMYDFLNQDVPVPKNTIEVQIPTIQVPGTPPSATKKTGEVRASPRQAKSKKKAL